MEMPREGEGAGVVTDLRLNLRGIDGAQGEHANPGVAGRYGEPGYSGRMPGARGADGSNGQPGNGVDDDVCLM